MNWNEFEKWFSAHAASGVDYIVRIMLKYEHENKYRIVTVLLLAEDDSTHVWNTDWHEGEPNVIVLACVPVDNNIGIPTEFRVT